jgi:hypothetical protein
LLLEDVGELGLPLIPFIPFIPFISVIPVIPSTLSSACTPLQRHGADAQVQIEEVDEVADGISEKEAVVLFLRLVLLCLVDLLGLLKSLSLPLSLSVDPI